MSWLVWFTLGYIFGVMMTLAVLREKEDMKGGEKNEEDN